MFVSLLLKELIVEVFVAHGTIHLPNFIFLNTLFLLEWFKGTDRHVLLELEQFFLLAHLSVFYIFKRCLNVV